VSDFSKPLQIPDSISTLGEAIHWAREQRNMTMRQLADKVGVSAPFMSDVEHGRRTPGDVAAVAAALGVPANDLLTRRLTESAEAWKKNNPKLAEFMEKMKAKYRRHCFCPWCRSLP
jgi:transcriptional regulator with XRE-family HTH domain